MWQAVIAAGALFGLMPYGTEAMGTLRIEKGHIVVGAEADGRTTADDLGLDKLVSPGKWCIGKPLLDRPALRAPGRWQLVGLTALDGAIMARAAKLVADPERSLPNPMLGHVTPWCWSPHVEACIALALVAGGRARHRDTRWALSPLAEPKVRVATAPPCLIGPQGEPLRACARSDAAADAARALPRPRHPREACQGHDRRTLECAGQCGTPDVSLPG